MSSLIHVFGALTGTDPLITLLVLATLIAAATALGFAIHAAQGRVRPGGEKVDRLLAVEGTELTLLQLSSRVCSACAAMRRVSEQLVNEDATVGHRELDVADHLELVQKLGVMSTPTTLVVNREGTVLSRIIGATTPEKLRATLMAARNKI